MKRYLLKVNGEEHCPGKICRPETSADWEGGEVLIPNRAPSQWINEKLQRAPAIAPGDELWIWAHEHSGGLGLTANAVAGLSREKDGLLAVEINEVELILHPFGYLDLDLGPDPTGSNVLNAAKGRRTHRAWFLDEKDLHELLEVVDQRGAQTPNDVSEEIQKRRLNWRKQRPAQGRFRRDLMIEYGEQCVLTECATPQALEAAHVLPHDGSEMRDQVDNGLLLRRDLHSMFDALLWSIDPQTSTVRMSDRVLDPTYDDLRGLMVQHSVAPDNLSIHFDEFQKADKDV